MALRRELLPLFLITALPLGLVSACGDEDPDEATDGDGGASPGGEASTDESCQSDKDCRDVDGLCDLGRSVCVDCMNSSHCGDNEECISGVCEAFVPCDSSLDCPVEEVCDPGLGRCVECAGDNDCAEGAVCYANRCAASCDSDLDCRAFNQVCEVSGSVCVDCLSAAECGADMTCDDNNRCVSDLSGGDGDLGATGGTSGDGDGPATCAPKVKVLLQRSGAVFENPSETDNWWDAVSTALDGDGTGDILDTYSSSLDLSVSTFHMTDVSCPIINDSADSLRPGDLSGFLAAERAAHPGLPTKVDAPLPEAVAAGAAAVGSGGYLILVVSGNPDSCAAQDDYCSIEPTIEALQAASSSGVTTKVLFLDSSEPYLGYEQAIANAGAGQPVAEMDGLGYACGTDPTYFSETGGSAPFEAPGSTSAVAASLASLLDSVGGCE